MAPIPGGDVVALEEIFGHQWHIWRRLERLRAFRPAQTRRRRGVEKPPPERGNGILPRRAPRFLIGKGWVRCRQHQTAFELSSAFGRGASDSKTSPTRSPCHVKTFTTLRPRWYVSSASSSCWTAPGHSTIFKTVAIGVDLGASGEVAVLVGATHPTPRSGLGPCVWRTPRPNEGEETGVDDGWNAHGVNRSTTMPKRPPPWLHSATRRLPGVRSRGWREGPCCRPPLGLRRGLGSTGWRCGPKAGKAVGHRLLGQASTGWSRRCWPQWRRSPRAGWCGSRAVSTRPWNTCAASWAQCTPRP